MARIVGALNILGRRLLLSSAVDLALERLVAVKSVAAISMYDEVVPEPLQAATPDSFLLA